MLEGGVTVIYHTVNQVSTDAAQLYKHKLLMNHNSFLKNIMHPRICERVFYKTGQVIR